MYYILYEGLKIDLNEQVYYVSIRSPSIGEGAIGYVYTH